ncbi:MAG TPA: PhzF family phenazine biosynthesis protein [Longimicrobiaceae bacterium]|nr:PhzF family phenazine biosynthesis protein [Longimicrobiaceae bacterium]
MGQTIIQVDAFTDRPFAGNPAAVCILPGPCDEGWMQDVAQEMNLSETAFLHPRDGEWGLRWFTPACEVDLCGHATLASAHVLWQDGYLPPEAEARFHTRSGLLTARREGAWISMNFPAKPEEEAVPSPDLVRALGTTLVYVGRSHFDYLVEVESEEAVRELRPDFELLRTVAARGIIVTSRSAAPGVDFVSRFFAPRVGVDEDPVTGSAHCCLAPYWARRLGKDEMVGFQASERGGTVRVRAEGDRVHLGGQAVTVLRGELVG